MARRILDFAHPDRFVAGAIGVPGDRTFYLQAREGRALVSVALEKVQVAVLATRLGELLDAVHAPTVATPAPPLVSLEEPLVEVFRVDAMTLGWDGAAERIVIEAAAVRPETEPGDATDDTRRNADEPDLLRVSVDVATARAFVSGALAVVAAGRPTCPFCGEVLEEGGHFCPRTILN